MIKIKDLTIYLQNHGFKYLKKSKDIATNCKALYFLQNAEVIVRLSILGYYPKGNQMRIDFYSIYQEIDDSILSYERDEFSYGNGYIFEEIFYDTLETINFIEKKLNNILIINTSEKLIEILKKQYKNNSSNFEIVANNLIITLNKKLNNYEEVIKGYQTLIDINRIVIDKLKKEEYFKYYYSRNKKYIEYKNPTRVYNQEDLISYDGFKIYDEKKVIDLLNWENKLYQNNINLIQNKQYDICCEELQGIENNNLNKLQKIN